MANEKTGDGWSILGRGVAALAVIGALGGAVYGIRKAGYNRGAQDGNIEQLETLALKGRLLSDTQCFRYQTAARTSEQYHWRYNGGLADYGSFDDVVDRYVGTGKYCEGLEIVVTQGKNNKNGQTEPAKISVTFGSVQMDVERNNPDVVVYKKQGDWAKVGPKGF